ncbi:MAG: membrane protein insertase YidC, partial [Gammaproteobacteria bacterium]|nr:membrane protein insertase YidC [Gammaproteobacteria bacterium]
MDIQRIVILAGLAVTAWLLLQAWQEDYGAQNAPAPTVVSAENTAASADLGLPQVPSTPS